MHRRRFLAQAGALSVLSAVPSIAPDAAAPPESERHDADGILPLLLFENDRTLDELLARQNRDRASRFFGGFPDTYRICHAGSAAGFIQRAAAAYTSAGSRYHESGDLLAAMQRAADFLRANQHDDGTIDLLTTNFHSTPDTGFVVEPLCLAYTLLIRTESEPAADLLVSLSAFLKRAGEALAAGGIHTPNHRWVVCMALVRIHALFPDARYVRRIETWLNEGIDIDADGQYTERSTHIYSPLTNRCLITIARLLDRPDLLEPVRKNLEMTLYYLRPNGEVVTEASGRQDQFQIGTLVNYAYPLRFLALNDRNGLFAVLSRRLPHLLGADALSGLVALLLEDPSLLEPLPPDEPLPTDFVSSFPASNVVRFRRGDRDATILGDNATFFTCSKGKAILQAVRFAGAFFGKGQFRSATIYETSSGFVLRQELEGPYYQPYPPDLLPGDGNWLRMPRDRRPQSEVQRWDARVTISEEAEAFVLRFNIGGTDHVPVALELAFRSGGSLSGVTTVDGTPGTYLLETGFGTYTVGHDVLTFGPGGTEHAWTQLRGALPRLDAECVYITGYTPFQFELRVS